MFQAEASKLRSEHLFENRNN